MNKRIRVGLLIDDFNMTAWEYRMLERIVSGDFGEVVLVVKRKDSPVVPRPFAERIKDKLVHGFFKAYTKIEPRLYKTDTNAFAVTDTRPLIGKVPLLEVECIEKKFSDYIKPEDLQQINASQVDVFLRLGFRILRGGILKAARLGIWSYHHGDNRHYRGGPAGQWEVLKRERTAGSILQILTEDLDGGEVLYRSWSSVDVSATRTINSMFWKTALFVPRMLNELHRLGETAFMEKIRKENEPFQFYSGKNYTTPRNGEFLRLIIPFFMNRITHKCWKIFNYHQWVLLYAFSKNNQPATTAYRYKRLLPPADRYWADPCVIEDKGKYFLFFEEVLYQKVERGHIAVAEINEKGFVSSPVTILKEPFHLSYPFVFRYEDKYYMIPESEESTTIRLYESVSFPFEWSFKMNLMENVRAVDTTLLFKDGKIWMFTNIRDIEGASYSEELFLYSADTLFTTDWKAHPGNPIVSDARSSRPAGGIFMFNNRYYRPSQDCSIRYGYATVFNEITRLDDQGYEEKPVTGINPEWADDLYATHTFSSEKGLSAIDAIIKRRKGLSKLFGR
jgi:hypothetical protein